MLTTLLLTFLAALVAAAIHSHRRRDIKWYGIPVLKGYIPFLGHLHVLFKEAANDSLHVAFELAGKEYGPLVWIQTMHQKFIIVSDPKIAKAALTEDRFKKSDVFQKVLADVWTNGLLIMPTDHVWKAHRKALQPAFGPSHLKHAAVATNDVGDELVASWDTVLQNGTNVVDVHHAMSAAALDIIGQVAFSHDFKFVHSLLNNHVNSTRQFEAFDGVLITMARRGMLPRCLWRIAGVHTAKALASVEMIQSVLDATLTKRRSQPEAPDGSKDFLDRVLHCGIMTEKDIKDETLAFFLAGYETTANTLVTTMWLLACNPECMKKLQKEVDGVVEGPDYNVATDMFSSMPYLEKVIKESLRLYSTVPIVERIAAVDTEVLGNPIPAGTHFLVSSYAIQRSDKNWDRALTYDPERWTDLRPEPGTYFPFGDGIHNCIGQKMAMIELKILLAKTVAKFDWTVPTGQNLDMQFSITVGFKKGLNIALTKRK